MSQTARNTTRIPSPTDLQILQLFEAFAADHADVQFAVSLPQAEMGLFRTAAEFTSQFDDRDWSSSRSLSGLTIDLPSGVKVFFHRAVTTSFAQHPQHRPDAWESEIWFYKRNDNTPVDVALSVTSLIEAYRQAAEPNTPDGQSRDLTNIFGRQMADLASLQTQIVVEAERARHQQEAAYQARIQALEAEANDRRARADEADQAASAELQKERERLAAREAEVDDRSHMHARREMRERITADLKGRLSRPAVSPGAVRLRSWIITVCAALGAIFLAAAVYSGVELAMLTADRVTDLRFYLSIGRFAASVAAVGLVGFYLLGWLRRIHDEDVRSERDLERYLYDVDRASWAIDTILEARSRDTADSKTEIPIEWIQGATHGLFARTEPKDEDRAASEALGALLNFAAEAKFGPAGPEFKITRRGLAQARKSGLLTDDA